MAEAIDEIGRRNARVARADRGCVALLVDHVAAAHLNQSVELRYGLARKARTQLECSRSLPARSCRPREVREGFVASLCCGSRECAGGGRSLDPQSRLPTKHRDVPRSIPSLRRRLARHGHALNTLLGSPRGQSSPSACLPRRRHGARRPRRGLRGSTFEPMPRSEVLAASSHGHDILIGAMPPTIDALHTGEAASFKTMYDQL